GNYSLTAPTLSASITAKTLTSTGTLAAANKVYDATTNATLTGSAGLLSSESAGTGTTSDNRPYSVDTVSVGGTFSGTFASKNVGTGISVVGSGLTLTGADAGNYALTAPVLSANITAAPLTVTANNQTKTYGSTVSFGPGSSQFTASGLAGGETIGSVTLASSGGTATTNAGTYAITPSGATGGTFSAS